MPSVSVSDSAIDALSIGDAPANVTRFLSAGEAQRLTQHIKLTASGIRNGLFKLRNLIEEAKRSNAWQVLGFSSWTAYLSDTLAEEPMRVSREERLELVGYLAGEGLSTRAIAPIVGVSHKTVARDIEPPVSNDTPEPKAVASDTAGMGAAVNLDTGEVTEPGDPLPVVTEHTFTEKTKTVTGLDGKTYTQKPRAPKPVPSGDAAELLNAETVSKDIGRALMSLSGMQYPEHRDRVISKWWPLGNEAVPPDWRALFEPSAIREIAGWLLELATDLEGSSNEH